MKEFKLPTTQGKQHGWLIREQKHQCKQVTKMLTRTKDAPKPPRRLPKPLYATRSKKKSVSLQRILIDMKMNFDQRGNLQPYEKITLTLDEFKDFFVGKFPQNSSRKQIIDNYLRFINDFSTQVATQFIQWIDGSFVTAKEHPRDIDFVTFVSHEIFETKERLIHDHFRLAGARKIYGVDAYTVRQYPEDHSKYMLYQSDWVYWYNWFNQTKKNRAKKKYPKGFIEIEFN